MPTPEWNRFWVKDLEDNREKPLAYYGAHWGDPNPALSFPPLLRRILPEASMARLLKFKPLRQLLDKLRKDETRYHPSLYTVLKTYLQPYIHPDKTVIEIGPGGGRWTQYMLSAKHLTLVELNNEFFDYLKQRFSDHLSKIRFYQTRNYELEGIGADSIDFAFSFGVFVHIDPDGVNGYLHELTRVVKPGGHIVIQYADKTKPAGRKNPIFSDMTPARMESFVKEIPALEMLDHNTTLIWHSSIIVLKKRQTI